MNESQMRNLSAEEWLRQEPETLREEQLLAVVRGLLEDITALEDECSSADAYEEDFIVLQEEYHQLMEETEALLATVDKMREALREHEV